MDEDEIDQSWQRAREPHERLQWARKAWQTKSQSVAPTAAHAAESMGMRPNTYTAYERAPGSSKHSEMGHQEAIRFGKKYGVRWEWLLTGAGTPNEAPDRDPDLPPGLARVVVALRTVPTDRQEAVADAIEALVKAAIPKA